MQTKFEKRLYQDESCSHTWQWIRDNKGNPVIVLPTGAGKSVVLKDLCNTARGWNKRVICLAHRKELVEQLYEHLCVEISPMHVGMYGASVKSRDLDNDIVVAQIQSCHDKREHFGRRDLYIIDECHLVSTDPDSMYQRFLLRGQDLAVQSGYDVRAIGLSATPYRMDMGHICDEKSFFSDISYEADVADLIAMGYLCPVRTKRGEDHADLSSVTIARGDYVDSEAEAAFEAIIAPACKEILACNRKHSIVFCQTVKHAQIVAETLGGVYVEGNTSAGERAQIVADFKAGHIKYLVNCGVFTTGFDAPNVDSVVLLRATQSASLYVQMIGRGLRRDPNHPDPDNEFCLVLDFGDNILRHGSINNIQIPKSKATNTKKCEEAPVKECPHCCEVVMINIPVCPQCGYEFPQELKPNHGTTASDMDIIEQEEEPEVLKVLNVRYSEHVKQSNGSTTLRVDYMTNSEDLNRQTVSEWVCLGHKSGFAKTRASTWWKARSICDVPECPQDAIDLIYNKAAMEADFDDFDDAVPLKNPGVIAEPYEITVKKDGNFTRIMKQEHPDDCREKLIKYDLIKVERCSCGRELIIDRYGDSVEVGDPLYCWDECDLCVSERGVGR